MIARVGLVVAAGLTLAAPTSAQEGVPGEAPDGPAGASGMRGELAGAEMAGHHAEVGPWRLMLHYDAALQVAGDGSDRGTSELTSTNWLMTMASRPWGGGTLEFRGMGSLEPFTVAGCGYPNLLQTGELCDGEPIVDAQHPHDLVMELSARWVRPLAGGVSGRLYLAPVGAPALGPTAFPHRASAAFQPLAPITHHWLDSSHIAFGVVTAGVEAGPWTVEGSVFNGREPDDDRTDFDFAPLKSYAARVGLEPLRGVVVQASAGRLNDAHPHVTLVPRELLCPAHGGCHGEDRAGDDLDVTRLTASATMHRTLMGRLWATTLAWGRNDEEDHPTTHALLLESRLDLPRGHHAFGRAEIVTKTDHDLGVRPLLQEFLAGEEETFTVGKATLGWTRTLDVGAAIVPAFGAAVSLSRVPEELEAAYGSRNAVGLAVYTRLTPRAAESQHSLGRPADPVADLGMEHHDR